MPPLVSIITVYYNTPDDLLRLFHSFQKRLPAGQYEFIVADNDSQQNLSTQLPGAIYLRLPENYGFGRANNLASEKATAPFLFFVNPDCEFIHDCVTPLVGSLDTAAVAGPCVLNADRSVQLSYGPFLSICNEALQKMLGRYEKSNAVQKWMLGKAVSPFHPDYVSGCALMVRSDIFRKVSGFDEAFFLYNEDVDLCKRIRDRGHRVAYVPSAQIVHARNRSVEKTPEKAEVEYRKSQLYYYGKHHRFFQRYMFKLYLSIKFILNWSMLRVVWSGKPMIQGLSGKNENEA